MIYLDNAATTLRKPQAVADAVAAALQSLGSCSRGTHSSSIEAAGTVYGARVRAARLLGCARPDHVVFAANATQALNTAIFGLVKPGSHVVTTVMEHNSVLRPLYRLEREQGVRVDFLPADAMGRLDYDALPGLLRPDTGVIICTHASNLTGGVTDLGRMAEAARRQGALLLVDAAQTAGCLPIHMEEMGIDVLCFTGHKGLMGPQGTGGLCLREGVLPAPLLCGGTGVQSYSRQQPEALPDRLEAGTLNGHGLAGLSAALDFILSIGPETIHRRELELLDRLYQGVRTLPGVRVYGDMEAERTAVLSLNIGDIPSDQVSDVLSEDYGIATRPGAHCAPLAHGALGTTRQGAVRFSLSWFTTEAEVDAAVCAAAQLARAACSGS